ASSAESANDGSVRLLSGAAAKPEADDSGRATCARAIEKIGMGGYSLLDNNCQHFAVWCKTGVAISGQTVLVNGGESDSAVYRAGIEAPALTGRLPALDRVPDLMGMFDIEVSRTLFASNYLP
ncbi:lecithin retinol acyltransferase family protein, partial [Corallococcus sp. AS-1-6]|uniref:lecithin retinol acyltransferase family protein n=1 Tax=Corallococcus sp. AS-1-6 TaxID=2874599 RepID=UPI001CBE440E